MTKQRGRKSSSSQPVPSKSGGVAAEATPSSSASSAEPRDTLLIHGVSEDGEKLAVLRAREDRVEAGVVCKVKEGEPLQGELIRLTPRPEFPLLCDVEVQAAPAVSSKREQDRMTGPQRPQQLSHGGPAQVATPSYRANWDAIWSKPKASSQLN